MQMIRAHKQLYFNQQMGWVTWSSTLSCARTTADVVCHVGASEHLQENPHGLFSPPVVTVSHLTSLQQ